VLRGLPWLSLALVAALAHAQGLDAQRLGDEQQDQDVGDREPCGEVEAVEPGQRDGARDTQERRGRDLVAGQRQAVLKAADAAARDVVVARVLIAAGGVRGQRERREDEHTADDQWERLRRAGLRRELERGHA